MTIKRSNKKIVEHNSWTGIQIESHMDYDSVTLIILNNRDKTEVRKKLNKPLTVDEIRIEIMKAQEARRK